EGERLMSLNGAALHTARQGNALSGAPSKISARGIERIFGIGEKAVHALGPVNLEVADGEFVSLVGPSGCGKSTFVRLVAGLLAPTAGQMEVRVEGAALAPIATVFQGFGIFPWQTVERNVTFALAAAGVARKEAKERAEHW